MPQPDTRIDMNLFRVLDAIYTHGGISGAARALHLTQPAITHSLNRLRELLDDPLFVRQGNRMIATNKTRMIMPQVQLHLNGLQATVRLQEEFDPANVATSFTVGANDPLDSFAFPPLAERLAKEAPFARIAGRRFSRENAVRELTAGDVDLVIERRMPVSPKIHAEHILDEPLVVVMRRGHRLAPPCVLGRSDYFSAQHVSVMQRAGNDPLDMVLTENGESRDIALACQQYFTACQVAARTDWLLTLPRSYAWILSQALPVALQPLPVRFKAVPIEMYWHESKEHDRAHAWFRQLLRDTIVRQFAECTPPGDVVLR
jgi:DNA-binding transcriptional LysR family regulator